MMPTHVRNLKVHNPHRRKGKPDKFSQAQVIEALQASHGIFVLAAQMLGCDRTTVAAYRDAYPAVRKAWEEAPERVTDIAEGHIVKGVIGGDKEDVRWWLRTRGRNRGYGDVIRQEVTGEGGGPIQVTVGALERKLSRIVDADIKTDALKPG